MKAILMSIRPRHNENILNGIKTLEIRKKFPIDYVGWVYIYCTKDQKEELWWYDGTEDFRLYKKGIANEKDIGWHLQNGKVIARFWCDKVEEINPSNLDNFAKDSCLTTQELENYLWSNICCGYAIHITKLEIFDEPKEISEFSIKVFPHRKDNLMTRYLTRAPQSWQFIEI